MRWNLVAIITMALHTTCLAASVDRESVNTVQWQRAALSKSISPLLIKAQVLLARAGFSPGEIDGKPGDNLRKAIKEFAEAREMGAKSELSEQVWQRLTSEFAGPVVTEYVISDEDTRGPFLDTIPQKLEEQKGLTALSYATIREKLAEKFHMSEDLLSALNEGRKFDRGARLNVVSVAREGPRQKAARVEVNKATQILQVFDRNDQLIAVYPATVGSTEKPAPEGRLQITSVVKNPIYHYNPAYHFKGVKTDKTFEIKPGPNNPVGLVWIELSQEGYGIHGTPEPSKVSKSESHGCVRLTNWDALELAEFVTKGTPVDFVGNERNRKTSRAER